MQIPEGCEKKCPPPLFFTYVRTPLQHLPWEKSFFLSLSLFFSPHPSFSKTYLEEQKFLPKQCKQHWRKVVIKRVLKEGGGGSRIASNVSSVSGVWVEAESTQSSTISDSQQRPDYRPYDDECVACFCRQQLPPL